MNARGDRLVAPDNTLDIAFSLARAGWPIFPVTIYVGADGKRHKVPAVPRGSSWVDWATTDPEKIATAWTGDSAGCWIGVHVGAAGLVVGDVDLSPVDGRKSLKACGLKFPPTLSYKTLGGGKHYIYRAPEGVALTNAQGLEYKGERIAGVDVRGGNGLFVYYGPALGPTATADLPDAPEWLLVPATPKSADRAPSADEAAYRDRLAEGKPDGAVKKALSRVKPKGMTHGDMLEAVTELVQLGQRGHRGVEQALDIAREVYSKDWPDAARHWDNAVAGSIKRIGLPPTTLELSKPEKKAIKQRLKPKAIERADEAVAAGKVARKAEYVAGKVELGEGQLTDSALAEALAAKLAGKWANAKGVGLLRYDGKVWLEADETELIEAVRKMLRKVRADETRAAILRGDKRHEDEAKMLEGRSRVVNIARFIGGILAEQTGKLDAHPDLLNVRNGVVDLRTRELLPHDPAYLFTKIAGTDYDPKADGTLWKKALKAIPKDVREWVQVRLGQGITGHTPEDAVMPIFEGSGQNGKSMLFDAVRSGAGDYAMTASKKLLLANPSDHPTELTDLMGARLAFAEELPEGRNLDVGRLKDVMGTATLTAHKMRQDNVTWKTTHSLFVNTNYRLNVAETDHGTWRRLALVIFPYKYLEPLDEDGNPTKLPTRMHRIADMRLKPYFETTADPAVLVWLVDGAHAWYANGKMMPPIPKRVRRDTLEWRGEADPVMSYVRERLELAEGYAIAAADLTVDFNLYLEQRNNKPWSDATIGSRFREHVDLPGVVKRQVRFGTLLPSRPPMTIRALPAATKAWVGVKFREADDDRIVSEAERDADELNDLERRMAS